MAKTLLGRDNMIPSLLITDADILSGAAIATSKLADGANFIKKDGSVVFTAAQSFGGFKATNLADPTNNQDGATKAYVDSAVSTASGGTAVIAGNGIDKTGQTISVKTVAQSRIAVGTGGVDLATTAVTGGSYTYASITVDGYGRLTAASSGTAPVTSVSGTSGRIAVTGTTTPTIDLVNVGTAGTYTKVTTDASGRVSSGTTLSSSDLPSGTLNVSNYVGNETPGGNMNGSNTAFTLAFTPAGTTLQLFYNGQLLEPGTGNDYTISGTAITTLFTPSSTGKLRAYYFKA